MRFWDSSAIVPVVVEERHSKACRQLLRSDPGLVVWTFTRTEVLSALWREHRDDRIDREDLRSAERRLDLLAQRWHEVDAILPVRERAERLLRAHALRAADALQLAAALLAVTDRPKGRAFVGLDERLAEAAEVEGFAVVRPRASR